jgi:hypothetical protein
MVRWALLLVAASVVVLCVAGVASATPPEHFTDAIDYDGTSHCAGFDDVYSGHLAVNGITTFDSAGSPVRDVVQFRGWETNYRSDDPSVTITGKRNFTVIYDYATDTETDFGAVFNQTAPGQGVLFHDVGSISFPFGGGDATVHGPHDIFDQGDEAFCNALIAVS